MFAKTNFMGVSMRSQTSRRVLVAATYSMLLAFAVAFERGLGQSHLDSVHWILLVIIVIVRGVFGRLLSPAVLPEPAATAIADLGLLPGRRKAVSGELDERDVSVRNSSVFVSYKALASWSLVVWLAVMVFMNSRAPLDQMVIRIAIITNLVLALTLPYALILWNEPDIPEEQ